MQLRSAGAAAATQPALLPAAIRASASPAQSYTYSSRILQVNVAETETEDQAVKRYMRAVLQSGVINKVCLLAKADAGQQPAG